MNQSSRESQEDDKSNFVTQSKSSDVSRNIQKKPLQRVDNSQEVKKIQNQKGKPKDEDDGEK